MPDPSPLTIAIVGGVAGGASAATRARRCNEHADIILFEKDAHVSFANCGLPYYIGDEIADRSRLLVATPKLFRDRFNIDVRTRQEVIAIDRDARSIRVCDRETGGEYDQSYDKLILAPGASPIVPPIDVDADNVYTLRNLEDTDLIRSCVDDGKPHHAVVVGAGYIGLEMVEQLVRRGLGVALVELQDQVLPLMDREMAEPLGATLRDHGVSVHLGTGITAIETRNGRAVGVRLSNGQMIETDLVILGIGVRPNSRLASDAGLDTGPTGGIRTDEHMRTSDPDIYAVGDAAEYVYGPTGQPMRVPLAGPANRAGRLAGQHAATGGAPAMAPVMGTAIVRVFDTAAGMTGLTVKHAERLGIEHRSVTIVANSHAGYYPGAKPITLKLVYGPDTGEVLGAQATGEDGVDKRIDVIASAMAFRGTVRDLAGLDLAYAPPFGSAKDPVHMAAFAASNQLDGMADFAPCDTDLAGKQVVDVRTLKEVQSKPLPGVEAQVVHIPLDDLRDRLSELDPARSTVVVCASGLRSYVAARILKQNGFDDVVGLSGGQTMRRRASLQETVS